MKKTLKTEVLVKTNCGCTLRVDDEDLDGDSTGEYVYCPTHCNHSTDRIACTILTEKA